MSTKKRLSRALAVILAFTMLLSQAGPVRAFGIPGVPIFGPVYDEKRYNQLLKAIFWLMYLSKISEEYNTQREVFAYQLSRFNPGEKVRGLFPHDLDVSGRRCAIDIWRNMLNLGLRTDALGQTARKELWSCRTLSDDDLLTAAKQAAFLADIAEQEFRASGASRADAKVAASNYDNLANLFDDDWTNAGLARQGLAFAPIPSHLAQIQQARASLLAALATELHAMNEERAEILNNAAAYEKIKKTLWQANMDAPYSGI